MAERLHFVGWLRVFLILLVVAHHAAEPYNVAGLEWQEIVDDPARSDLLLWMFLLNRTYFMGFFFLIAAYFMGASYDRKGAWAFTRSRLIRLGVPLVVFVVFVWGSLGYAIYGAGQGYFEFLAGDYLGRGNAEFGPLWFTAHLLVYTLVYVALRLVGLAFPQGMKAPGHGAVLAFALALGLATAALRPVYGIDEWVRVFGLIPAEPGRLPQYIGFFVVGIVAGRGQWFTGIDTRVGAVWGGIAAAIYVAATAAGLPRQALGEDLVVNMAWGLLEGFVGTGMILGLLVLFRQVANVPGRWLHWLEGNVYGVYLIHIFVVIGLQVAALGLGWTAIAKFLLVWIAAAVASFAVTALLRMIPGVKRVV